MKYYLMYLDNSDGSVRVGMIGCNNRAELARLAAFMNTDKFKYQALQLVSRNGKLIYAW